MIEGVVEHIGRIIANISFKGGNVTPEFHSAELAVVQDANRLDAMIAEQRHQFMELYLNQFFMEWDGVE
jgi:HD superfamily phosphodiesterase